MLHGGSVFRCAAPVRDSMLAQLRASFAPPILTIMIAAAIASTRIDSALSSIIRRSSASWGGPYRAVPSGSPVRSSCRGRFDDPHRTTCEIDDFASGTIVMNEDVSG